MFYILILLAFGVYISTVLEEIPEWYHHPHPHEFNSVEQFSSNKFKKQFFWYI